MLFRTGWVFALVVAPSLAWSQVPAPPSVRGNRIDPVKADPMPQGIRDLLVFTGAPAEWRPPPGVEVAPPIKGLSSADKLALVKRAASTSGAVVTGSSMSPYLMLTRAMMGGTGRGQLTFWGSHAVTYFANIIGARSQGAAVVLEVYPEAAGRLYLAEWQVSGYRADRGDNACRLSGSGGRELTFRLSGGPGATTIIPAVFVSASTGLHGFRFECDDSWRFTSVEVSVLR